MQLAMTAQGSLERAVVGHQYSPQCSVHILE